MNRKRGILVALLGVLTLCLLYAYFAMPQLEKAPPRSASQRAHPDARTSRNPESNGVQERINLDFTTVEAQAFPGAKRDIFHFGGSRMMQRPPRVTSLPQATIPVDESQPLEPVAAAVVERALAQFTFLGFLEKSGEKTVFLSSGGTLFLVKRGEDFGAKQEFTVVDIDDDLLKVRHVGQEGLIKIQLIEQQSLSASVSAPARMEPASGGSSKVGAGAFKPKRRVVRPAVPLKIKEPFPEISEVDDSPKEQESALPAEGDVLKGEVNGTNQ